MTIRHSSAYSPDLLDPLRPLLLAIELGAANVQLKHRACKGHRIQSGWPSITRRIPFEREVVVFRDKLQLEFEL